MEVVNSSGRPSRRAETGAASTWRRSSSDPRLAMRRGSLPKPARLTACQMYDSDTRTPAESRRTLMSGTERYCLRSSMICSSQSDRASRAGRPRPAAEKKSFSGLAGAQLPPEVPDQGIHGQGGVPKAHGDFGRRHAVNEKSPERLVLFLLGECRGKKKLVGSYRFLSGRFVHYRLRIRVNKNNYTDYSNSLNQFVKPSLGTKRRFLS